jgi:hypothetical protein
VASIDRDGWNDRRCDLKVLREQMTVWVEGNNPISRIDSYLQRGGMELIVLDGAMVFIDEIMVWEHPD